MPFEGINFNLLKPTVALQDPSEIYAKVLQIKNMQTQGQLGQMQFQEAQQKMADEQQARSILQEVGGDPEKAVPLFRKRGMMAMADNLEKAIATRNKAKMEFQAGYSNMNAMDRKTIQSHLEETGNGARAMAQIEDPQERYTAYEQFLRDRASELSTPVDGESDSMRQKKAAMVQGIAREWQNLGDMSGPEDLDKRIRGHINTAKTQTEWLAEDKANREVGDITGGIHADSNNNAFGVTKGGKSVPILDANGRPQKMKPPASGMGGPGGFPANPNATAGSAQERLAGVPLDKRALVRAVGTYQMLTTQLSPRQKNEIMGYVAQVFPNYNIGDADAAHKFIVDLAAGGPASAGGIVGASERLLGHIGEAAAITDKLGNSSLGKLGNVVGQGWSTMTGTGNAGDVKALELVKGKVIAELSKLVNGGVPEAKQLADDVKNLTASDPPEVKYKVLQAAASVGLEQTHALEAKRNNLLGEFAPQNSFLSPRAQEVVKKIWSKAGAGDPGLAAPTTGSGYTSTAKNKETMGGVQTKAAPGPTSISSKAEYDALPSGALYKAKDGTIGRKP